MQVPQTERLYYTNARLATFSSRVVALRDQGPLRGVALESGAFYPTSGGQPHDTGRLGGVRVVDVTVEEGVVWHWLEDALPWKAGDLLEGAIDWPRRFDHMQQHSAQHLLSRIFARLLEAETLSVHFGDEESTIDLDIPTLDAAQVEAVEAMAAEMTWAALPITAYSVDEVQVSALPLRKPPAVHGEIRIVEIAGFDWSACGGTHCATTAEAGPMKIVRLEKRRGGVRVSFVAGGRALADYARKHALLLEAAGLFSSDIAQAPVLIQRQLAAGKESARRIEELSARLLAHEAAALLAAAQPLSSLAGAPLLVVAQREDLDAAALRTLATQVAARAPAAGALALLASVQEGQVYVAFARSAHLPQEMGSLLRDALQWAGGKGGGRPDFAQGGGVPVAEAPRLLAWAAEQVRGNG